MLLPLSFYGVTKLYGILHQVHGVKERIIRTPL